MEGGRVDQPFEENVLLANLHIDFHGDRASIQPVRQKTAIDFSCGPQSQSAARTIGAMYSCRMNRTGRA